MDPSKIGLYLNAGTSELVRITSPYWLPEPPDWVMVTSDPNASLLEARRAAKENGLIDDPSTVFWARIPARD